MPFRPLEKPYQPASTKCTRSVMGSTGAGWIDSAGDGLRAGAWQYANETWKKSRGNIDTFIRLLNSFDEAVAVQAASILHSILQESGWSLKEARLQKALSTARTDIKLGFQNYLLEWDQSKIIQ